MVYKYSITFLRKSSKMFFAGKTKIFLVTFLFVFGGRNTCSAAGPEFVSCSIILSQWNSFLINTVWWNTKYFFMKLILASLFYWRSGNDGLLKTKPGEPPFCWPISISFSYTEKKLLKKFFQSHHSEIISIECLVKLPNNQEMFR